MGAEYFYGDREGYERFVDTRCCAGATPGNLYAFGKRAFDIAAALAGLSLLLPLLPFIVLLIKLETPGPVLFRQTRVGRCGRLFDCFKFRSMSIDAETRKDQLRHLNEANGAAFKIKDDPRITGVGRFLRRSSLDEFPQLLNVLRGEMSLVGPRPDVPAQRALYTPQDWDLRCSVRPGITGLAQALIRSDGTEDQRLALDLRYVAQCKGLAGLWLDLKIMVWTLSRLTGKGAN